MRGISTNQLSNSKFQLLSSKNEKNFILQQEYGFKKLNEKIVANGLANQIIGAVQRIKNKTLAGIILYFHFKIYINLAKIYKSSIIGNMKVNVIFSMRGQTDSIEGLNP